MKAPLLLAPVFVIALALSGCFLGSGGRDAGPSGDGLEQYRRPVEDFDEVIRIVPRFRDVYAARAIANALLGHRAASQRDIDNAVELGLHGRWLQRVIRRELKRTTVKLLDCPPLDQAQSRVQHLPNDECHVSPMDCREPALTGCDPPAVGTKN